MRSALLAVVAATAAASWPRIAAAHQSSFTSGTLTISDDRRRVDYRVRIRGTDLYEALGTAADAEPTAAELRAGEATLYAYLIERVTLAAPGQTCALERAPLELIEQRERFARFGLALTCPEPIASVELDYQLFFDLDPDHVGLVAVDGVVSQLRAPDDTLLEWQPDAPRPSGFGGFVISGVHHIFDGPDHIAFLFSLLIVVVFRREHGGHAPRPLGATLRYAAALVTAFTVAHSLTLIAAALGWVALPTRLVESAIAASIVLVAIENLVATEPRRRPLVTFGCGLIHGLGFASVLAPLLPPEAVVAPLLAFNLGVELGQLALVALGLLVLTAVARALGAERYASWVVPPLSVGLIGIGTIWLVERAFEIRILGW